MDEWKFSLTFVQVQHAIMFFRPQCSLRFTSAILKTVREWAGFGFQSRCQSTVHPRRPRGRFGQIVGARESLNGRENMARRKVKNGEKRCCQSRSYLLPDPLPPPRAVKRPRRFLILNFIKEAIINQQVPITRNNMQQGVQRTQHACNI